MYLNVTIEDHNSIWIVSDALKRRRQLIILMILLWTRNSLFYSFRASAVNLTLSTAASTASDEIPHIIIVKSIPFSYERESMILQYFFYGIL